MQKQKCVVVLDGRCWWKTQIMWMTVVKICVGYQSRASLALLLHALLQRDQQQEPEFEVGLLRRKPAVLLTTPPPAKIPLPPKPSSPIFNHPSLQQSDSLLFPHPPWMFLLSADAFLLLCLWEFLSFFSPFLPSPTFLLQVYHIRPQTEQQKVRLKHLNVTLFGRRFNKTVIIVIYLCPANKDTLPNFPNIID